MSPGLTPVSISSGKAKADDWPRIRELCCLTGNAGAPIAPERWPFFSENWVGPYQALLPEWTYVLRQDQRVVGYLTGCPNTVAFERLKAWRFHPGLLLRVVTGRCPRTADTSRYVRRTLGFESEPNARCSEATRAALRASFPAHLHINLDASVRGQGLGGRLVDAFAMDLKARGGVPGVHVFCGQGPVKFYLAQGFTELERVEFNVKRSSVVHSIFVLGRSF